MACAAENGAGGQGPTEDHGAEATKEAGGGGAIGCMACAEKGGGGQGPTEDHGAEATKEGEDAERRLILVGKSGAGKSATGNTILGRRVFQSTLAAKAITTKVQEAQGTWEGKSISVIDTPALFDSKELEKSLEEEREKCLRMCQSGLHAFLLVIQVGRFTAEDKAAAERVWKIFGDKSAGHTILLFTCKEDLGGDPLETYVRGATNKNLRSLLKKCRHRFCGFNNKAKGEERDQQVSELMKKVDEILQENKGKPYFIPQGSEKPNVSKKHAWWKKKDQK